MKKFCLSEDGSAKITKNNFNCVIKRAKMTGFGVKR